MEKTCSEKQKLDYTKILEDSRLKIAKRSDKTSQQLQLIDHSLDQVWLES